MTYVCPTEEHKERFKDHEMSIMENGWVKFAKPGTNIDMLCFNTFYGYLTVIGDLGDAVYQWGERITLDWVAGCSLDYVLGKCQASEVGRDFHDWDASLCHEDLEKWAVQEFDEQDLERPEEELKEAGYAIDDGIIGWQAYLYRYGHELFGSEFYEFAPKFGVRPHIRGVLHLAALKVMKEKKDAEAALKQA